MTRTRAWLLVLTYWIGCGSLGFVVGELAVGWMGLWGVPPAFAIVWWGTVAMSHCWDIDHAAWVLSGGDRCDD